MMTDKELKSAMDFILTQGGRTPYPKSQAEKARREAAGKARQGKEFDAMAALSAANERILAARNAGKPKQPCDGFPWEPGIYTRNFEGAGISAAQTKYNSFLTSMAKRPNFKILHQNFTEFFNGVSIFVTYSI